MSPWHFTSPLGRRLERQNSGAKKPHHRVCWLVLYSYTRNVADKFHAHMLEAKGIRTCSKARCCISLNDPERLHWHLRQMDPEQRRTIENFIENYWPKSAPSRSTVIAASFAIACLAFRLKTYISVTCFLAKWIITICW